MEFDDLTRKFGQFGKYQKIFFFVFGFTTFQTTFSTMNIVFLAALPEHWCQTQELSHLNLSEKVLRNLTLPLVERNGQSVYSSCSRYQQNYSDWTGVNVWEALSQENRSWPEESCPSGWDYDSSIYTSTIVSEWDLVCDRQWLRATVSSLYMAGFMIGVLVFTSIADIVGRRPVYVGSLVVVNVLAVTTSFSVNFTMFCVMRFLAAVFGISLFTVGFVEMMEIIGPEYRTLTGIGFQFFWAVAYMMLALFAYLFRDWSMLALISSCAMLPFCIPALFIPESPRWLYLQGCKDEADTIMRKVGKINRIQISEIPEVCVKISKKGYFWDLWRTPYMAKMSAIVSYTWLVNSCVYYGLSLNTSNLDGNPFLNFFLSGAVEVVAYAMCVVVVHYVGRRWPLCLVMLLAGVALLAMLAVPTDMNWLTTILAMTGKFGITASFAIIYIFTAELYPTVVRSVGVGCGSFSARIGGVIAPFISELGVHSRVLPLIVFGVMSLSAGMLSLLLPETKGRNLPDTIEDIEKSTRTKPGNKGSINLGYSPDVKVEDPLKTAL